MACADENTFHNGGAGSLLRTRLGNKIVRGFDMKGGIPNHSGTEIGLFSAWKC